MKRRRSARGRWPVAAVVVALFPAGSGCSPGPPAEPATAAKAATEAPRLARKSLASYVPAAGLRWMVVGRPADLAGDDAFSSQIERLIPREGLDAYSKSSGVDLRAIPDALVAGFDFGRLYAAKTGPNEIVEKRFVERLLAGARVKQPHPRVRIVTGVVGRTPEALVRVEDDWVAVAVGDTTYARVAALFALDKLRKSPPALEGAALSSLPDEIETAPIRLYFPGPFTGEWVRGARGLLAAAFAMGVAVQPAPGAVRLTVYLSGDWQAVGPESSALLLDAWEDLAKSPTGVLLGLDRPAAAPIFSRTGGVLKLTVELRLRALVDGLRAAVAADVREILQLAPPRSEHPAAVRPPQKQRNPRVGP